MIKKYEYDVALSFAGEDREYVEAVATSLEDSSIKVFYDKFEQVDLWGKDLYTHLDDIYRNKARFCVIFISENYRINNWTNHERESAQAREFREKQEYILPAYFDNTEIPGVRPTVAYINLQNYTPQQFAELIIKKLELACPAMLRPTKSSVGAISHSKPTVKAAGVNRRKPHQPTSLKRGRASDGSKSPKPNTKTVDLTVEGISQLPNDKPVVYKILTEGGRNNYTGVAKRGKVQANIQKHLQGEKNYVPGSKVCIERMDSIQEAQHKADRIIRRSKPPKYNKPAK
jgi:hypothetical protein